MSNISTIPKALATVPDENGNPVKLTLNHLENIQAQVAKGWDIEAIAVCLVVDVDHFIKACEEVPVLKEAVRRGYILDKHEFSGKLRAKAHKMDSPQLTRMHASYKHGIEDKSQKSGGSSVQIIIDTGIHVKTPWNTDT